MALPAGPYRDMRGYLYTTIGELNISSKGLHMFSFYSLYGTNLILYITSTSAQIFFLQTL